MKFKLLLAAMLATLYLNTAIAGTRVAIINKEVSWTIYDAPCGTMTNPDELPLKDARAINLLTNEAISGCALDNGTFVEFQMVLPDGKHFIDLKFPSKYFKEEKE